MNGKSWKLTCIVVLIAVTMCVVTHAAKQKKKKPDYPDAVKKTIKARYRGAAIQDVETEQIEIDVYEAELRKGPKRILVTVSPDGKLIAEESTTVMQRVSPEAAAMISEAVGDGKVRKVTAKVTYAVVELKKLKKPQTTYEARLTKGGQRKTIEVTKDGTVVKQTEWRKPGTRWQRRAKPTTTRTQKPKEAETKKK